MCGYIYFLRFALRFAQLEIFYSYKYLKFNYRVLRLHLHRDIIPLHKFKNSRLGRNSRPGTLGLLEHTVFVYCRLNPLFKPGLEAEKRQKVSMLNLIRIQMLLTVGSAKEDNNTSLISKFIVIQEIFRA